MSSLLLLASLTSFHSSSIPPFPSPSAERTLYEIFFLPFLKSRFVGFLKGSDNSRWNTQWLSLTFDPLFYRSFDLLHDKGGYNIIKSCQKKIGNVSRYPPATSMSAATQIPQWFRETWLWRLLVAWQDCNQGKLIQALHSSSKSTSSSVLWSPNVAIYLMRMTCPD